MLATPATLAPGVFACCLALRVCFLVLDDLIRLAQQRADK